MTPACHSISLMNLRAIHVEDGIKYNEVNEPEIKEGGGLVVEKITMKLNTHTIKKVPTNTGFVLLRTDAEEMNRMYNLTRDSIFMKRFGSDQN